MGKKKRGHPDVEEILARPWCYYCERDFDDLKILINHQKAKHFKCERCGRRLNTAGGLSVHMTQVHKETLTTIENALPNRSNLDVEIFGMEGIPEEVVTSHNQRVISQFTQAEADRRAATGNPSPGGAAGGAAKKPKVEAPSDLKKRLAEHKAKKMAEQAAGISSGDVTPIDGGIGGQSPGYGQADFAGSPGYPQPQMPYGGPSNGSTYASYPQPYGQQGMPFQQQPPKFPQQSSGFGPPLNQAFPGPNAFSPPQQFQQPGNPNFAPPPFQNGPLQPPYQNNQGPYQSGPPQPQFQNGPPLPPFQSGPSRAFGSSSSPVPFHQAGQFQPPRTLTPPQIGGLPQRSGSLPAAPGLPQRPSFGAPPVNAFQMQQMHQGQIPGPPNPAATSYQNSHNSQQNPGGSFDRSQNGTPPNPVSASPATNPTTQATARLSDSQAKSKNITDAVDDLISTAAADADKALAATESQTGPKAEEQPGEKKAKKEKEKEKAVKMVYSDNEVSPEEKMAKLPRYAFVPDGKGETVLADATTAAAVTGVVKGDESTMAD